MFTATIKVSSKRNVVISILHPIHFLHYIKAAIYSRDNRIVWCGREMNVQRCVLVMVRARFEMLFARFLYSWRCDVSPTPLPTFFFLISMARKFVRIPRFFFFFNHVLYCERLRHNKITFPFNFCLEFLQTNIFPYFQCLQWDFAIGMTLIE